jgi:ABC-2 type transport system permease protein
VKKRVTTYWQFFWKCRQVHLMRSMEYRTDFLFWGFVSVMWTIFNVFFFSLILNVSDSIAGWSAAEMYILLAIFTIVDAFTWSFFYHNMSQYTQTVFSGELSQVLLKPLDAQFMIMTQSNSYNNIFRLLLGILMLFWAVPQLSTPVTISQLITAGFLLALSLTFIYFLWFCISTLSFWVEKLDNINEVIPTIRRVFQVPADVFTGIASTIVTVILPLGLVTTLPSNAVRGGLNVGTVIYFFIFTFLLILFSRWFFFISIKKFTGSAN